ncbi:hypothetical protein FSP39_014804 [Pinctada imbricata]|uniref:Uncharacterized protein n=1 Tax=Pinctada imbricata TaxID=66713 RepID=A0AA88XIW6_PINIB|nr:hypothetical protein FSP39_014804 [Pinctada imbricata]
MATESRILARKPAWHLQQSNMATNMADVSYSDVVQNNENELSINSVKPIFIEESDIFGNGIPSKDQYLTHVEMYKSVGEIVPGSHLKGLQRVRGLWRIYLDCEEDRENIISNGLTVRRKQLQVYSNNPRVAKFNNPSHLKVRVKNVPCSADDGQIVRCLEQLGCVIHNFFRERLRVDGMLTNCQTGDRIIICDPVPKALPRSVTIGKYRANIIHRDQNESLARKIICFREGHRLRECPNDWVCSTCHNEGHKQADYPLSFSEANNINAETDDSFTTDGESETDLDDTPQPLPENMPDKGTSSTDVNEENSGAGDSATAAPLKSSNASAQPITDTAAEQCATSESTQTVSKKKKKTKKVQQTGQLDRFFKPANEQGAETPNSRKDKRSPTTPTDELHLRSGTGSKSLAK